jgi:hypothetical protein
LLDETLNTEDAVAAFNVPSDINTLRFDGLLIVLNPEPEVPDVPGEPVPEVPDVPGEPVPEVPDVP